MLTQEQINKDWTVRSDNYNNYVEEEFATDRPKKWLELIESQAPDSRPLRILDAGCGPGFFSVLLSKAGHQVTALTVPKECWSTPEKMRNITGITGAFEGRFRCPAISRRYL